MKNALITLFIINFTFFLSCQLKTTQEEGKINNNYPSFVIENNLTKQYDRAKWELYKINGISGFRTVDYLVNLPQEDSVFMKKYLKMREEYKDDIYSFYEDTIL